jgi:hypothetical protein
MGIEPNASHRLRLLWATTLDGQLRRDLSTALEAIGMSFVPSADLLRQIAICPTCESRQADGGRDGLCETHRARWNLELCLDSQEREGEDRALDRIMTGVLASEQNARAILAALDRQLRALHLVWEAHERGAVRLPDRIAESVHEARLNIPRCLPAGAERPRQVQTTS